MVMDTLISTLYNKNKDEINIDLNNEKSCTTVCKNKVVSSSSVTRQIRFIYSLLHPGVLSSDHGTSI